jgi:hypothetical protein
VCASSSAATSPATNGPTWSPLTGSPALIQILAGHDGDDVLALLANYYQHAQGQLSSLMNHPDLMADFSDWHS